MWDGSSDVLALLVWRPVVCHVRGRVWASSIVFVSLRLGRRIPWCHCSGRWPRRTLCGLEGVGCDVMCCLLLKGRTQAAQWMGVAW